MVVAPFVPEAAVRDATAHWFEVFIETGVDFLGSGERDARVSDAFRAVLVQELGDGARRPAGDQLEGIGSSASGHDISDPAASAILAR
jgi:hypothetical protein